MDYPYTEMFFSTLEKLKSLSFVVSTNVDMSDRVDKTSMSEDRYPYVEVSQGIFGPDYYEGQVNQQGTTDILVKIYAFQKKDPETGLPLKQENYRMIMNYGIEALNLIYSFEEDKLAGNPPCQGFIEVGASTQVLAEPQLDDSMMICVFAFSINLINLTAQ